MRHVSGETISISLCVVDSITHTKDWAPWAKKIKDNLIESRIEGDWRNGWSGAPFFFLFSFLFLISQKWPSNFDLVSTLVSQSGQLFRILFWKEKVEERERESEENQVSVHFPF